MQKNILVVDDDPTIGDLIQEVLEQAGYGVQRAYSGTEALLVLEPPPPGSGAAGSYAARAVRGSAAAPAGRAAR